MRRLKSVLRVWRAVDDRGGAGAIIRGSGWLLINYLTLMRSFFNLITILTPT